MKAKSLITIDDYVVNPNKPLFNKIPKFIFHNKEDKFIADRSGINYGTFKVEELANKRAQPILNAIVTYFFESDEKLKEKSFSYLKSIAEEYKED